MRTSQIIPAILAFTASASCTEDFHARNFKTVQSIYNLTVYPNNVPIRTNGSKAVPPGLFAETASGRVTPIGNFTGFDDSIEYFFALAPVPSPPLYAAIGSAPIFEFSSGCPEVAASVVYLQTHVVNASLPNNGDYAGSLKQVAFWRFDDSGAVVSYDAWIPNLNLWASLATGGGPDVYSNPQVQNTTIQNLCGAIQQRCAGADQQYTNVDECITTLSAKSFGSYDEVWGDNVVCRSIHLQLTTLRPDVHCPHVGPTGGGKCSEVEYDDAYFASDQRIFGQPQGQTFTCPGRTYN